MERPEIKTIRVKFDEGYGGFFDELINIRLSNRKSDSGLIDKGRPMIGPRMGSYRIGNALITDWSAATSYVIGDISYLSGVQYQAINANLNSLPPSADWSVVTKGNADALFYTDRARVRRHYRVFDKKLWYLNSNTWTSIKTLQTDSVKLQVQRIPMMLSGGTPTEYTTGTTSTAAEKVRKAPGDPGAAANVGKILVVTNGIYKGAFAPIIDYNSGSSEYTTGGAGIITALPATATYRVFDTMGDALQVCRGYESNSSFNDDLYFDGITELTHFQGYATATLRQVLALTATEGIKKSVQFVNKVWSFSGSTLFYSGGLPGNPFFYDFTGALTLGGAGEIIDIIPFKNRLIVIGASYIYALNSTFTFDKLVESYGGFLNGAISTGEDLYVLTTQRTLISIAETISGFLTLKNITQEVDNYVKEFTSNICTGFDGRYMFIYGDSGTVGSGKIVVLDLQYKFWSVYEGLYPKKIIAEGGLTYFYDNNTDIVRVLSALYTNDVIIGMNATTNIAQRISLKEIDLDDIFTMKILSALYIAFENYSQQVQIDVFMGIDRKNGKKTTKYISIQEVAQSQATIGSNDIGGNLFGGVQGYEEISIPLLEKIDYNNDKANVFKLSISGKDQSFFYISNIDIMIGFFGSEKQYFKTSNTY